MEYTKLLIEKQNTNQIYNCMKIFIEKKDDFISYWSRLRSYLNLTTKSSRITNQKVGKYELRNVESAIICYLALEKVSDDTDLKSNWRQKIEEVEQIAQIKNGKNLLIKCFLREKNMNIEEKLRKVFEDPQFLLPFQN